MRWFRLAVLYTALALGANAALADVAHLEALREGTMKKLVFSEPREVSQIPFTDPEGNEYRLEQWKGKYVLLNFWATWCVPCRREMPALEALQNEFGGENFEVVTIATGRNPLPGIRRFFREIGVTNLPILLDPKQTLGRDMAVFGLPTTMLLDREGREIARVRGDAEWDSESAFAIIRTLIAGEG